jgi:enamine deaminase RidA (YjgF/YER057c/UK114 family)
MLCKVSSRGIGYSVVELGATRHVFASAVPRRDGTLPEQLYDALQVIAAVIEQEGTRGSIVKQAVFVRNIEDIPEVRRMIGEFYGDDLPATTYVPQPPCDGKLVAIEAMGVGGGGEQVDIRRLSERTVITSHDGVDWIHLAHITPETDATRVYDRTQSALEAMSAGLTERGYRFEQVLRTWLYLGDIVGREPDPLNEGNDCERYREMNRARADFYAGIQFGSDVGSDVGWAERSESHHEADSGGTRCARPTLHGLPSSAGRQPKIAGQARPLNGEPAPWYPASTGIGTDGDDLILSCIALATRRSDVRLVALENPLQTSAFEYEYVYGQRRPRFSRAMAVASGPYATTFISGTASITGSDTQHPDDVAAQTTQTFDNIEALIGEGNFARHGLPGRGATLRDLALVRVYIKRQHDYPAVRAICESRLGEVPTVYAVADICRPDLLVEVEGLAFSKSEE